MKYFTLASFSLGVWKASANTDYTMTADADSGPINFLSLYLSDTGIFNGVVDHGCWCNNLDSNSIYRPIHGGSYGIDGLDEYCRSWLNCRTCSAKFTGGTCYQENMSTLEYSAYINHDNNRITCNTHDPVTGREYTDCEFDTCVIDKYYIETIGQWITDNGLSSTLVTDPQTCGIEQLGEGFTGEKECLGEGPFLSIAYKEVPPAMRSSDYVQAMSNLITTDITFMVDGTVDLDDSDFAIGSEYMRSMMEGFSIDPDTTRVSIVQFTDETHYHTSNSGDSAEVDAAFDDLSTNRLDGISKNTAGAMQEVTSNIQQNKQDGGNSNQIVILLTAGTSNTGYESSSSQEIVTASENMKAENVTVYTIAIGANHDYSELNQVATDQDHVYTVDKSGDLGSTFQAIQEDIAERVIDDIVSNENGDYDKDTVSEVQSKLSDLDTFECFCNHGEAKSYTCSGDDNHECSKCDYGYTLGLAKDGLDQVCVPVTCFCDNGTVDDDIEICDYQGKQVCRACDSGWKLDMETFLCIPNVCTCSFGRPYETKTGQDDCTVDGGEHCVFCNEGYVIEVSAKSGLDECVEEPPCDSGYHLDAETETCELNICDCFNGMPVGAPSCTTHGAVECESCDPYYHADGLECVENVCTCPDGVAVPNVSCDFHAEEQCSQCITGPEVFADFECENGTPVSSGLCSSGNMQQCDGCNENYVEIDGLCTPLTSEAIEELCSAAEFDLIIVMDGSGSVGDTNFATGMDFLDNVVNSLTVGPDNTRVTVYQYASDTTMYGNPFESDPVQVQANLDSMRNNYMRMWTHTHQALYYAWLTSQEHGRAGVPQVVFLVTDGKSTFGLWLDETNGTEDPKPDGYDRYYAPNLMHDYGITAFSIGVGTGVNNTELEIIATDPDSDHMFSASSYDDLDNIMAKISAAVCLQSDDASSKSRTTNYNEFSLFDMDLEDDNNDAETLAKLPGAEVFENLGQINTMPRLVADPDDGSPE